MKPATIVTSLAVLLTASTAVAREAAPPPGPHAQETADQVLIRTKETRWSRHLKSALRLPDWLDLGLENRTRFEVYDHPWRPSQTLGRTDPLIVQRSRLRFGLNAGPVRFLFEGQDSRVYLDQPNDFVNTTIKNLTDIQQLFVSATTRNLFDTGLRTDLHFGRLTMDFGRRRLIARNDFRNTTNAFDGVHWQLAREKAWRVRAFLVEPVIRNEEQLDEQSANNVFWGAYYENQEMSWLRLNAYYFGLNNQQPAAAQTFETFGVRLYEDPNKGRPDYEVEGALQTGKRGTKDHFAWFGHLDLGYTVDLPWSPRFLIHYDYASGDRNPNDSQDSAFDTLFGARRFEYMPSGAFGPFFRTNLSSPGWRVIAVPRKGWKVQLKHRVWYLATSRGALGNGAEATLRDLTGGSGNYLGQDVELRVQYKVNRNLELDAGYDHWFKGTYFDRLPASAGLPPGGEKDTDYFYVSTKFRF